MNNYTIPEVTCRLCLKEMKKSYITAMNAPQSAVKLMQCEMKGLDREMLAVVNLDSQLKPINWHIISIGGSSEATFYVSNIFKTAILSNAVHVMLFHNHPGGDVSPSLADITVTKAIKDAGKLLGIQLLDHIIIGSYDDDYYSFFEHEKM